MSVESIVANPGNTLRREDRVLAGASGEGGRELTLALLGGDDIAPEKGDRIAEAPAPLAAARRMQGEARFANRLYGRWENFDGAIWLQYWLWLYDNPKSLLGFGRHEGDWEMVQVTLQAATLAPVAVTFSQHGRGEVKEGSGLDEVEWRSCEPQCTEGCRHPVAYVAPFSHASYFEPGTHFHFPITDNPDGAFLEELPQVETFGPWKAWPGRWGGSTGIASTSPPSPGCQKEQWNQARFQQRARRRKPREERLLWQLGRRTFPATPLVESAVQEGDTVVVDWRLEPGRWWRRARWVLLTVETGQPPRLVAKRVVRAKGLGGQARITIGSSRQAGLAVRASAFNRIRQRSDSSSPRDILAGTIPETGAPRARDDWSPRVWKWFCRAVLDELIKGGSATLNELELRRVSVLDLALDPLELNAVVEHARRTGLITPDKEPLLADGSPAEGVELVPSADARLNMRGPLKWAVSGIGAIPSAALVAIASLTFKTPAKELAEHHPALLVLAALLLLEALVAGVVIVHRRIGGASPREIARQWSRHAVEYPALNRWHQSRVNFCLLLCGLAGSVLLESIIAWDLPFALLLAGYMAMLVSQLTLVARFTRYRQLQLEAKVTLEYEQDR